MKIVVAIKQVPAATPRCAIAASGNWIDEADLSFEINEPDAYALEEGLQLKEKHGGEVVARLAGPRARQQTIREALAKGADRAIHIEDEKFYLRRSPRRRPAAGRRPRTGKARPDPHRPAVRRSRLRPDRRRSWRSCSACRTPPSSCRWKCRTARIRVKRELEDGWFQHVEMPLPALLTIQSGINKLRYAT